MTDDRLPAYCPKNRENLAALDMPRDFWSDRRPGLSAMLRVKNEEDSIGWCLESIQDVFDEIVVALQNPADRTEDIIAGCSLPNVRVFHYPFDSYPNGPGHDLCPADSVRARSYFYNWTLTKTTRTWACKWDGDMVAMDGLREQLMARLSSADIISFRGVNLVGKSLAHHARKPFTAIEPRLFKVAPHTFYRPGRTCEVFNMTVDSNRSRETPRIAQLNETAFVHLKWNKPESSFAQAWPKTWRNQEHFQRLFRRRGEGEPYAGPYPSVLRRALGLAQSGSD